MNVLMFLANNWQDVLVVIILVLLVVIILNKWIQKNGPLFKQMNAIEKMAYVTRLLQNLMPTALMLVTNAEIRFGPGTGKLKRSYVIDELYKRIPDEYKKYITEDNLEVLLQNALEDGERLWDNNSKVKALVRLDPSLEKHVL